MTRDAVQGDVNNTTATPPAADDPVAARVLEVCDAVGAFIQWWGFKAVHGRVWTLLALRGAPMAQAEVGRLLGLSRAGVSGAMHDLERWRLVEPVGDERTAPWQARLDVWPTIASVLRGREWLLIESARSALFAAIEEAELAAQRGRPVGWDLERMRTLLHLTEAAQAVLQGVVALRSVHGARTLAAWVARAGEVFRGLRA